MRTWCPHRPEGHRDFAHRAVPLSQVRSGADVGDRFPRKSWQRGGRIVHHQRVSKIQVDGERIVAVEAVDPRSGQTTVYRGDWFFSTMPVKDLVRALDAEVPAEVREVSEGLIYRDFITVGLLLKELKVREDSQQGQQFIRDNWIYIQEPDVLVGRLQIFNNWSPYMVSDRSKVWVGLEYFCYESDDLWKMSDQELIDLGSREMERIGIIERSAVLDATVIRMPKTYPAYFGTYDRFDEIRRFVDRFPNLFLLGRNGMHRYNNQDHSMLTAMVAVDNIVAGSARQVEHLGREHRAGLSRGEGCTATCGRMTDCMHPALSAVPAAAAR